MEDKIKEFKNTIEKQGKIIFQIGMWLGYITGIITGLLLYLVIDLLRAN